MADEHQNGGGNPDLDKNNKSKEEAEESFLKEIEEEEKKIDSQPERASAQPSAPEKKKDSFSSRYKSLLNKPARKRSIDPILGVCFTVFILCSCVVIANTVYSEVVKNQDLVVESGDTVEVDYVGSFNDYYTEDGAVVFDTSKKSIGTDDEYPKSWTFNKDKDSYNWLSFEAGGSDVLTDFGAATIGHKVGDRIEVHISPENGYILKASQKGTTNATITDVLDDIATMTTSDFKTLYGYTAPTELTVMDFPSDSNASNAELSKFPFGLGYTVFTDNANMVHVTYNFGTSTDVHSFFGQDEGAKFKIDDGDLVIQSSAENSPGLAMINNKLTKVFFNEYSPASNANELSYKLMYDSSSSSKSLEAYGVDLYFVIEIKKITKA